MSVTAVEETSATADRDAGPFQRSRFSSEHVHGSLQTKSESSISTNLLFYRKYPVRKY